MTDTLPVIAAGAFRDTLGRLPTGVTVITMAEAGGTLQGVTIGSAASLSLDPPLVLFSLDRTALCHDAFVAGERFAINVLAEDQTDLSRIFAAKDERPWADLAFSLGGASGAPLLSGCLAHIECARHAVHPGGDHSIIIGRVLELGATLADGRPLLHFGGGYRRLDTDKLA